MVIGGYRRLWMVMDGYIWLWRVIDGHRGLCAVMYRVIGCYNLYIGLWEMCM